MLLVGPAGSGESDTCLERVLFAEPEHKVISPAYTTEYRYAGTIHTIVNFEDSPEGAEQAFYMFRGGEEPSGPGMKSTNCRIATPDDAYFKPDRISYVLDMDSYTPETLLKIGYEKANIFIEIQKLHDESEAVASVETTAQIYEFVPKKLGETVLTAIAGQ